MVQLYTCVGISPVEDLQLNFNSNNSLNITWSPPVYNSDDISIDFTVSYNVLLTNKTGDIIVDKTTTDTFIEVVNITDCDTFDVSVTALKGQYVSSNNTGRNNGSEYNIINSYKACKFLQFVNNFVAGFEYQYSCQCRFKQSCAH